MSALYVVGAVVSALVMPHCSTLLVSRLPDRSSARTTKQY